MIDEDLETCTALLKARDAFHQHLNGCGYDPAYWDIKFTCWQLTSNDFQRLRRFEIEDEVKEKP